jgi:hypothetical protein
MKTQQNRWMPLIAGIGIGAAAATMMRGQGGQLKKVIPQITNMAGGMSGLNNLSSQSQGQGMSGVNNLTGQSQDMSLQQQNPQKSY